MSKRLYSVSTDNSYLWVSLNTVPKTEKPPTTPWKVTGECIQHISTPHTDWFTGKLFWIRFDCSMTQCARTPNLLHIYGLFVYNRFFSLYFEFTRYVWILWVCFVCVDCGVIKTDSCSFLMISVLTRFVRQSARRTIRNVHGFFFIWILECVRYGLTISYELNCACVSVCVALQRFPLDDCSFLFPLLYQLNEWMRTISTHG